MNALNARLILAREGRPFTADVLGPVNGYRHSPNSVRRCSKCYDEIGLSSKMCVRSACRGAGTPFVISWGLF